MTTQTAARPNLFIIGGAKCGTTSLYHYLRQHPEIFMADNSKSVEPAYFADGTGVSSESEYLQLFSDVCGERIRGEKSVAYLWDENAAKRIRCFAPDAKLICLLRDPVDMAYSYYCHNRKLGLEPIRTFAEAMERENERYADPDFPQRAQGYYANFFYRRRAIFYPQMKRYLNTFERAQMIILQFADLKRDAKDLCARVFRFLDVDDSFEPDISKKINVGAGAKYEFIQDAYFHNALVQSVVQRVIPPSLRRAVRKWNSRPGDYAALTDAQRMHYRPLFQDDLDKLSKELGIVVSQTPLLVSH